MDKIIIVGKGDISRDVEAFIKRYDLYDIVGYAVNERYLDEQTHNGLPVYPVERLEEYVSPDEVYFYVAINWFHYLNRDRRNAYLALKEKGYRAANLISPKATVLGNKMGGGNWIGDFAYIDVGAELGSNNILRNRAYVAHWTKIGSHNLIGVNAIIGGETVIGDSNFIGINAAVFNAIAIGDKCIIGGASVVKNSLPSYCQYKIANESFVCKQYTDDTIEQKLQPGFKKKFNK